MSAFFLASPPTPYALASASAPAPVALKEIAGAYHLLTLLGILGGGGVYLLARLLRRFRRGEPPVAERVGARRVGEEVVALPKLSRPVAYPGARGRIVRAYVWFEARAARLAVRRRPSATPREFAAQVRAPAAPLHELTELFVRARYGPEEPSEGEAQAAERAARVLVGCCVGPEHTGLVEPGRTAGRQAGRLTGRKPLA